MISNIGNGNAITQYVMFVFLKREHEKWYPTSVACYCKYQPNWKFLFVHLSLSYVYHLFAKISPYQVSQLFVTIILDQNNPSIMICSENVQYPGNTFIDVL